MTEVPNPGTHDFEVVSSRTVYDGAIVALRLDELLMPGGHAATREVVEHHAAVAIVARDADARIALVRQYRHPVGRRLLELPAGLLDNGPSESPLDAAKRELAEEADVAADRWQTLVDLASSPGFTDETLRVFLAEGLHPLAAAERADEEADMSIEWVDLDAAVGMVFAGEIVTGPSVAGILAAAAVQANGQHLRHADAPWADRASALDQRHEQA